MEELKIDIPERFYSDTEEKPFEYCQMCGKYLLEEGTYYVVEKALKNYKGFDFSSTIYEFAVCLDCHEKVQGHMSQESLNNLQNYYREIMLEKGQQPIMIDVNNFNLNEWLSSCFFKGDKISELNEYQIVAQFNGDKMILNTPPLVIGERAMEEMSELLSDKTIDEMNGFREQFLGPSPEIEELLFGKKLILL